MSTKTEQAVYSHGHHRSVVEDHARRTAQDSAAFLIPHIKPTDTILDLGCGPGTITADLAELVPQGRVVGGDPVESVLKQAAEYAQSRGVSNVTFEKIDGNQLSFPDDSFDVVTCHQVLQHVKDPVGILKEMRRVVKPGGIVAAREADYKVRSSLYRLYKERYYLKLTYPLSRPSHGTPNPRTSRAGHSYISKSPKPTGENPMPDDIVTCGHEKPDSMQTRSRPLGTTGVIQVKEHVNSLRVGRVVFYSRGFCKRLLERGLLRQRRLNRYRRGGRLGGWKRMHLLRFLMGRFFVGSKTYTVGPSAKKKRKEVVMEGQIL